MRLLNSIFLPALAGIASAAASSSDEPINAEAYILRQSKKATSSSAPSIPNELAQAILLQRLGTPESPSVLGELSSNDAEAVDYINQFGKPTRPLFAEADATEPKQLIIAISGVTDEKQRKVLHATTSSIDVSFTSPHLSSLPTEGRGKCAFAQAIDPKNSKCWNGKTTQYLQYDAVKDAKTITELGSNLATLKSRASNGEMETVILFLAPPTSSGSDNNDELRRRGIAFAQEQVLTEHDKSASSTSTSTSDDDETPGTTPAFSFSKQGAAAAAAAISTPIPACFSSFDACMSGTSSCSGHGECAAKWTGSSSSSKAARDDGGKIEPCYVCRCLHTTEKDSRGRDSLYRWGGAACQKIDVSTPFWLFAGVTIALVGTIAFSVSLLFSVGEEKLPGVIGAGVSRGGGGGK